MPLLRANAQELLKEGLDEILFRKYSEIQPVYQQIFNIRTSKKKAEEIIGFSGFGAPAKKEEGASITYDDPYQGFKTTFTHITYGLGFRVTKEMLEDDLYNIIQQMPSALADTIVRFKDTVCANVFNNGFSSTGTDFMSGGDGQYLFDTDHPLKGGGTCANTFSTQADLSVSSLEEAINIMRLTKGDRGEILDITPKILLVPPQLERTAWELVKSAGRPDTANRADNWLATQNLQIVVWSRLTDSDAWFLLTDKAYHNLIFYNRIDLETEMDRDFDTKDYKYSALTRFSVGWADWRGVFGSSGA